jgi:phosphocarrier protein
MKTTKEFLILNELGVHARPAAAFAKLAGKFQSEIFVEKGKEKIDGKTIIGLMMLAATKGSKIKIIATGSDSAEAIETLGELVNSKFGEE